MSLYRTFVRPVGLAALVVLSGGLATLTVGIPIAPPAHAQDAACARDLAATDAALTATLRRLEGARHASPARRCAVLRSHVETMRRASAIFARCTTGRHRDENVGQMEGSIADFEEIIAERCGGR